MQYGRSSAKTRTAANSAEWQRCVVHFYRNVFSQVPNGKVADVARMLKAIHAQEDRRSAESKVKEVITKLKAMRPTKAAELVERLTSAASR